MSFKIGGDCNLQFEMMVIQEGRAVLSAAGLLSLLSCRLPTKQIYLISPRREGALYVRVPFPEKKTLSLENNFSGGFALCNSSNHRDYFP